MEIKVDFLGIGAQKSATTWLSENLRKHPDIWMPPVKELHYFDRIPGKNSGNKIQKRSFIMTYKKKLKKPENRKPILKKAFKTILKEPLTIYWLYKYFYTSPDDRWYLELFKLGINRIKGEITPEYSILNEERVKHINQLLPDTKIIFLIRNPIDRCWSQFRFYHPGYRPDESKNKSKISRFIENREQEIRGNYKKTIDLWLKFYKRENLFIGYFDDIQQCPESFYKKVTNFLGVENEFIPQGIKNKVLVSKEAAIPPDIRILLAKKYHRSLCELSEMLGGHTTEWLKECENILNSAS